MKIKKSCGCPRAGSEVTRQTLRDYIFFVMQQANKNNKTRAICIEGEELTDYQIEVAEFTNKRIWAIVPVGIKKTKEIEKRFEIL